MCPNGMHPRIQELIELLEEKRLALRRTVEAIPREQRDRTPADGRWSVAQIIEHLAITDRRFAQLIKSKLEADPPPKDERTDSILGTFNFTQILNRTIKIEAREALRPTGLDSEAAFYELQSAREELLGVIRSADGLDLSKLHHAHPLFGELNLYQWLAFIAMHEARHTDQILEAVRQ